MGDKMIIGLSRLMALRQHVDSIARNIANLNTTGFKRQEVQFREYLQKEREADAASSSKRSVTAIQQYTDFSTGPLNATGNPMDVAVADDAFFVVQTTRGERYTRSGSFALDAGGRLVSQSGEPVMSSGGPIRIPQSDGPLSIAADGTVSTPKGAIARLRLVRFDNMREVNPEGGGLFFSARLPSDVPAAAIRLVVGALEGSNVVAVSETAKLSDASRTYQEVAKVLMRKEDDDELKKLAGQDL